MLKHAFGLITLVGMLLVCACSSVPSVSTLAMRDQAIGATYTGLAQQLGAQWKSGAREEFAARTGLSIDDTSIILRHLDRYPVDDFRVEWVLIRYPHYSADALRQDYERLQKIGVVAPAGDDAWQITEYGIEVYDAWRTVLRARAERYDAQFQEITGDVLAILDKVIAASAQLDDGHINKSILWRTNHRLRWSAEAPALLRIDERMGDQIAFQNDNAHYRINIYASAHDIGNDALLELSPLAHELYGATRRSSGYPISRCYSQSNWRVTKAACDAAIAELIGAAVVVEKEPHIYEHTPYGANLFRSIEAYVDKRRYRVWAGVSRSEYERYMAILARLPDFIQANAPSDPSINDQ